MTTVTSKNPPSPVDVRTGLTRREFYREYVNRKPVLMKGALAHLPAAEKWSLDYFASVAADLPVRLKTGRVAEGRTETVSMADYCKTVAEWEERAAVQDDPGQPPAYLHDVPLLSLMPELRRDLDGFTGALLPRFFREQWWVFPQFFVGPSRAETPLHFDTLLTHNLFFQFHGRKRFLMVSDADRKRCGTYNWRWSAIDPDAPDLKRFPQFAGVPLTEAIVEGGDLFYMPPGTLHKVTSQTASVSFNIDWHDHRSALKGLAAVRDGMPAKNLRYNALLALGVWGRVPLRVLMPALKSYFVYIS
ncbi:cupin-like domain-containing protein [Catenulispora subtropica]|uniref:JmjC domain-containing protein n=1 Tax=Catenulispora subtropica TaxID=450798 RepID=A0ABN2TAC0_9ACTN